MKIKPELTIDSKDFTENGPEVLYPHDLGGTKFQYSPEKDNSFEKNTATYKEPVEDTISKVKASVVMKFPKQDVEKGAENALEIINDLKSEIKTIKGMAPVALSNEKKQNSETAKQPLQAKKATPVTLEHSNSLA